MTRLLTVAEAAEQLRCSAFTIRRRLREGELEGEKHGDSAKAHWYVTQDAIDTYRQAHSNTAVARPARKWRVS